MKIIHVNKFFGFGSGVETYMHALMDVQRKAGHEVHVFATRASTNIETEDAKYFVERMDLRSNISAVQKAVNFVWNVRAEQAMARMIADIQPDVIHLHNIYHHLSSSILRAIRRAGVPCVHMLHDYKLACPSYSMFTEGSPCERCKGGKYYEAIRHHCLTPSFAGNALAAMEMGFTKVTQAYEKTVQCFLCPSQFMRDKMVSWGEPATKFLVVPNPLDAKPTQAPGDGSYVLYVGRVSPEKGIDVLIRAMAMLPKIPLKIVGSGRDEGRLRALAHELRATNVEFTGFKHGEELAQIRQHAALVAVPSIWYENAPYSILEPMADGIPVIGSRIGGIPEMIAHEQTGWLVEAKNVDAWAREIQRVMLLPLAERLAVGKRAQEMVRQERPWSKHAQAVEQAYHIATQRLTESRVTR